MSKPECSMQNLEEYFKPFREKVVGYGKKFDTPYGEKEIIYADWTASGRLYQEIEDKLHHLFGPFVGNTHTETTITGTSMTIAYHEAKEIIKKHVNADKNDVILMAGSGMTGAINKFQRILGLKIPEQHIGKFEIPEEDRPIVFVTHMEHHSNHTTWLETIADVEFIPPCDDGTVKADHVIYLLHKYQNRKTKIAAVTSCSNVTGIMTPYHEIARIMHAAGGLCFVDFAASAPYIPINMHPDDPMEKLDGIYFSPHKFLGGPGTSGVLIFDSKLYTNKVPDCPGGGTVTWTNPWEEHSYFDSIEVREDGGTPPFLQTIRTALCIKLKEQMGPENMLKREEELIGKIFPRLKNVEGIHILADNVENRLGVISFYIDGLHYNLGVKLLNDRFGIQTRGGCACAGTYGHYLLYIRRVLSREITDQIDKGDFSAKPGWIRLSIHPVMSDGEIDFVLDAIDSLAANYKEWAKDYEYDTHSNEYVNVKYPDKSRKQVCKWFDF